MAEGSFQDAFQASVRSYVTFLTTKIRGYTSVTN